MPPRSWHAPDSLQGMFRQRSSTTLHSWVWITKDVLKKIGTELTYLRTWQKKTACCRGKSSGFTSLRLRPPEICHTFKSGAMTLVPSWVSENPTWEGDESHDPWTSHCNCRNKVHWQQGSLSAQPSLPPSTWIVRGQWSLPYDLLQTCNNQVTAPKRWMQDGAL